MEKEIKIDLPETRGEICAKCRVFHPSIVNHELSASIRHPANNKTIKITLYVCDECANKMDIGESLMSLLKISLR